MIGTNGSEKNLSDLQEQRLRGPLSLHPTLTAAKHGAGLERIRLVMADLVQIRQGYRAKWHDLMFVVESGDHQWTLQVQDAGSRLLYTAGRANRAAAEAAGLEFAIFGRNLAGTQASPEALARSLVWQKYW
jgi:hypothetical protein